MASVLPHLLGRPRSVRWRGLGFQRRHSIVLAGNETSTLGKLRAPAARDPGRLPSPEPGRLPIPAMAPAASIGQRTVQPPKPTHAISSLSAMPKPDSSAGWLSFTALHRHASSWLPRKTLESLLQHADASSDAEAMPLWNLVDCRAWLQQMPCVARAIELSACLDPPTAPEEGLRLRRVENTNSAMRSPAALRAAGPICGD